MSLPTLAVITITTTFCGGNDFLRDGNDCGGNDIFHFSGEKDG